MLVRGTGRKYCTDCRPLGSNRLSKVTISEKQMMFLLDIQAALVKLNRADLRKRIIRDEKEQVKAEEALLARVKAEHGIGTTRGTKAIITPIKEKTPQAIG